MWAQVCLFSWWADDIKKVLVYTEDWCLRLYVNEKAPFTQTTTGTTDRKSRSFYSNENDSVLPLGNSQRKGGRVGRWPVSRVRGKSVLITSRQIRKYPCSYLLLLFLYPHPLSPPGWYWRARELEIGGMCLSPPSMKTCHLESMQWLDVTCWTDLWTLQFIQVQVLGRLCSTVKY